MPSTGLLALADDIATIADDVAKMTAAATKKAGGIVVDDMAVTAENMQGIRRERELGVIWDVAKGSLKNKMFYLVPGALALSALAPAALPVLLLAGGAYLSYEGAEKIIEKFHKHEPEGDAAKPAAKLTPAEYEKQRVDGAIRTDMVLSGEIMVMGLDTMAAKSMAFKMAALPAYGLVMTAGVYGIVAGLVKMDDAGEWMAKKENKTIAALGHGIVKAAPAVLHGIAYVGTAAMLAVGGHLVAHNLPGGVGHMLEHASQVASNAMGLGVSGFAAGAVGYAVEIGAGLATGLGVAGAMATGLPSRAMAALSGPVAAMRNAVAGPVASVKQAVTGPFMALRQRFKGGEAEQVAEVAAPTPQQAVRSEIEVSTPEVSPTRMMRHVNPPLPKAQVGATAPAPRSDNQLGM